MEDLFAGIDELQKQQEQIKEQREQQESLQQQMLHLIKLITKPEIIFLPDDVVHSLSELIHDLNEELMFEAYFRRFQQIIEIKC